MYDLSKSDNKDDDVLPVDPVSSTGGEASKYMSGGKKGKSRKVTKKTQRKTKNARKTKKTCWWKFW